MAFMINVPHTSPENYLTGYTALNVHSPEGTGDWHTLSGMDKDIPDPDDYFEILKYLEPDAVRVEPEDILFDCGDVTKLFDIHLGNAHLSVLFSRLQRAFENIGLETDFFINSIDSHFYFNGDMQYSSIRCLDDYLALKLPKVA